MSPPRAWAVDPSSLAPHAAVWPELLHFSGSLQNKGRCLIGNTRLILWDGVINPYTKAKNRAWHIVHAPSMWFFSLAFSLLSLRSGLLFFFHP